MREGLVGVSHTVDFLLALEGATLFLIGGLNLGGEFQSHRLLTTLAGEGDEVLHAYALLALGADLRRNLECGTADTLAAHLHRRSDIAEGLFPNLETVLFGTVADNVDGLVENLVGRGLLATHHQVVDKLRNEGVVVFGIRKDYSLLGFCFSHFFLSF